MKSSTNLHAQFHAAVTLSPSTSLRINSAKGLVFHEILRLRLRMTFLKMPTFSPG